MTPLRSVTAALALAAALASPSAAPPSRAEQGAPPSNVPSPAETNPLPTTTVPDPAAKPGGGTPAPVPQQTPGPVSGPSSVAPAPSARQTLVPTPGEANDVDAVSLPAKPAAILSGRTTWEAAVPNLKAAFKRIEDALAKAGITPAGRPLTIFVKTEEDGFQYDAMIPIEAAPAAPPAEADGLRFGATPSGRALRFKHNGSYDEIDGTYETLQAYLDAKEVSVKDQFIEEYVTDLNDGADEKLDVNIYALTK